MASRGPLPKDPDKRERRNAEVAMTELDDAAVEAPPLPGRSRYVKATREWYEVWCRSPQAGQFLSTDWLRLHMLAKLVDQFHRAKEPTVAKQLLSEIRLNEQKLGGTAEDRLRLRWRMAENAGAVDREERAAARGRLSSRGRVDPRLKLVEERSA
jgi:hypothetical protein